jgi:hypothetical protein
MSTTTSKGYRKPTTGDRGTWFTDLEHNIDRVNAHKHDNIDSERVASKDLSTTTQDILAAAWGSDLGFSTYRATVTFPTGVTFENHSITFIDTDNGHQVFPTVTKASSTTMTVDVNDNTLNLKVIYG